MNLQAGVVRIESSTTGNTVGTGFVVSDEFIVTCAHVISSAGVSPGSTVGIAYWESGESSTALVDPGFWRASNAEDIAFLRVSTPHPRGVNSLALGSSGGTSGHEFKTFGFPGLKSLEGLWGYGRIGDRTLFERSQVLQLFGTTEITSGFSGAPVLDILRQRVVGMVSFITSPDQSSRLTQTAFIVPSEVLILVCPRLELSDLLVGGNVGDDINTGDSSVTINLEGQTIYGSQFIIDRAGDIGHIGDNITVSDITDSEGLAIGREARSNVKGKPDDD